MVEARIFSVTCYISEFCVLTFPAKKFCYNRNRSGMKIFDQESSKITFFDRFLLHKRISTLCDGPEGEGELLQQDAMDEEAAGGAMEAHAAMPVEIEPDY
jgi:hypothetical protein